jgi:peptidyl-prolyl cis-trans isomerase B (cyclophilin B)
LFRKILILALLPLLAIAACAPEEEEYPNPLATIEMEDGGIIEIELYPDIAPNTVRNFIALAKQGFYDGLTFHRVIPGFMIQGGCPLGTGGGDPGYYISGEFSENGFENSLKHKTGVISMARLANNCDSAGSQFFITVGPSLWLDGQHAAFGKVISGLEIAQEIAEVAKDENGAPLQPQRIKKITVNTFGRKYDPPEKIRR